jgi:lipid II:glycine glycyltransferase (peptidoglycan interpeptide bridge formation enzyme)
VQAKFIKLLPKQNKTKQNKTKQNKTKQNTKDQDKHGVFIRTRMRKSGDMVRILYLLFLCSKP